LRQGGQKYLTWAKSTAKKAVPVRHGHHWIRIAQARSHVPIDEKSGATAIGRRLDQTGLSSNEASAAPQIFFSDV